MNKFLSLTFLVMFLFLSNIDMAQAIPQYWTFEGTVTDISQRKPNTASLTDWEGISLNDSVNYVLLVDVDEDAFNIKPNGEVTDLEDMYVGTTYHDRFYTDYISGSLPSITNGAYPEYLSHFGSESTASYGSMVHLYGNNSNNKIHISTVNRLSLDDIVIGSLFKGSNMIRQSINNQYTETTIKTMLTLTRVEDVNVTPVPEPGTLMLLGLGLIGLAGIGRKKKKKKGLKSTF